MTTPCCAGGCTCAERAEIARLVASAPPPTDDQARTLAALFLPEQTSLVPKPGNAA